MKLTFEGKEYTVVLTTINIGDWYLFYHESVKFVRQSQEVFENKWSYKIL